jgi:hypothetical protein
MAIKFAANIENHQRPYEFIEPLSAIRSMLAGATMVGWGIYQPMSLTLITAIVLIITP